MTDENKKFYSRLGITALMIILLMVVAKLLFFSGKSSPSGGHVIRPISPSAQQTSKVIFWQDASKHYGEFCTVEGTIVATHNSGKACFLNFHPDWKRYFTAVIFANQFGEFPTNPERYYRGKKVQVTGFIKEYNGKPEIILESPDQIKILN